MHEIKPIKEIKPPAWAKQAIRFEGTDAITLLLCQKNAEQTCKNMDYGIRPIPGGWEWYSPMSQKAYEV